MEPPDTRAIWSANAPSWTELARAGFDVYRDLVNTPAFMDLLPEVEGLRTLDLGCGEGHNTRLVADRGASVVALDVTEPFIRAAAGADGGRGLDYLLGDGAALPFASASFDLVTAFMSLMDVADPEAVLAEVARVLRPGGVLQLSVTHPATATPIRDWIDDDEGRHVALATGGYFDEGPMAETWTFGSAPPEVRARHRPFEITYARRTVSGWLTALLSAGFELRAVVEPHADEATAEAHPEVADTRITPFCLLVQAARAATS